MGRIKGWKKVADNDEGTRWAHWNGHKWMYLELRRDYRSSTHKYVLIFPKYVSDHPSASSINGYTSNDKSWLFKKAAEYMRSHPNG